MSCQIHQLNLPNQLFPGYYSELVAQIKIRKTCMQVQPAYHQSAAIIIIILNAISFSSLAFVLLIYISRWKKITSFPLRLSFYLCLSCLVQNLYVLMLNPILVNKFQEEGGQAASGFCVFEGVLKVSSDLSSIIWTSLIIYSSFASLVLKKTLEQAQISYLILGYLFPIILAVIPIFFDLYGYNTYFCWFDDHNKKVQFGLKMGLYFIPLWIAFFLTIFLSSRVYSTLKKLGLGRKQLTFFSRLMLFPWIMLCAGFFDTINTIYNYASGDCPQWLDDLATIGLSLYGLCNSIAYGFNPIIRQEILRFLRLKHQDSKHQTQLSQIGERYSRATVRLSELIG